MPQSFLKRLCLRESQVDNFLKLYLAPFHYVVFDAGVFLQHGVEAARDEDAFFLADEDAEALLNQAREDAFLKMLLAIDSYSIDGERLMLIKSGDVLAIFDRVVPDEPATAQ